jgi:Mn-dependent DtxR family transcriptional regulator
LIQDGLTSASDIAEELKVAKSTVCKAAKKLADQKLVEIHRRQYYPAGFMKKAAGGAS